MNWIDYILWKKGGSGGGVSVEALSVVQNGTYTAPSGSAYSPVSVNVPAGGGSKPRKDVNFFDYDGTIVESYTAQEAAALSALPANPSHDGLTAQGWNYTLAQMKAEVTAQGKCDIGQMYITDDGKTRVYVTIPEGRTHPYLGLGVNGTVVVDWGDGSETSTLTGTSLTSVKDTDHVYAAPGDYVITLEVTSGSYSIFGTNGTHLFKNSAGTPSNPARVYANAIRKVEIGASASIGNYAFSYCSSITAVTIPSGITSIGNDAFQNCYSITAVTIPSGVTSIGSYVFSNCASITAVTIPSGVTSLGIYVFQSCSSLTAVTIPSGVTSLGNNVFQNCSSLSEATIPSGVTSIGTNAFQYCYSLTAVTIPSGVTIIGNSAFSNCYSLTAVTIPSGVTSIGTNAFQNCYGLAELHFLPATPPAVSSSNAFSSLPTDCIIYVPAGTLEAYTTATNYPSSSTYTYVEE